MQDKELKMKLMELLMSEMDEMAVSKLKKPEEPMALEVEMEAKELPMDELSAKMEEKMSGELPSEPSMPEDDEEDYGGSRLMEKLKALKKPKM